jgi:hypothetical protein
LQLLLSGQITTEASISAAVSLAAAAEIGRSKAGMAKELEGIITGMGSLDILTPSQVLALQKDNKSLREQVQALKSWILDETEKPMGPSREAEKDQTLWFQERDQRIEEATSNVSLAFGPPPILYVPRSQVENEARLSRDAIEAAAPSSAHVNLPFAVDLGPGLVWRGDSDDEMTFDDD